MNQEIQTITRMESKPKNDGERVWKAQMFETLMNMVKKFMNRFDIIVLKMDKFCRSVGYAT